MDFFEIGQETEEIIQSLAVLVFFGLFSYAYCKRTQEKNNGTAETSADVDDVDFNNGVSKKDMKALKNLKKDLDKKMDKVAKDVEKFSKLEEKIKKTDVGNLQSTSSQAEDKKKPNQASGSYASVVSGNP